MLQIHMRLIRYHWGIIMANQTDPQSRLAELFKQENAIPLINSVGALTIL